MNPWLNMKFKLTILVKQKYSMRKYTDAFYLMAETFNRFNSPTLYN